MCSHRERFVLEHLPLLQVRAVHGIQLPCTEGDC
jgi:hypothetical protein